MKQVHRSTVTQIDLGSILFQIAFNSLVRWVTVFLYSNYQLRFFRGFSMFPLLINTPLGASAHVFRLCLSLRT